MTDKKRPEQSQQNVASSSSYSSSNKKRKVTKSHFERQLKRMYRHYSDLFMYVKQLDERDGKTYLPSLAKMSKNEINAKIVEMERIALRLGFDEAREMQRGRDMNVFDNDGDTDVDNVEQYNSEDQGDETNEVS